MARQAGWNGSKTDKDRKFLSDLKFLCTEYNDFPFEKVKERVKDFISSRAERILFIHIREPPEIERAKIEFNAKTILVKRNSIQQITSNEADANVFNYGYDIVINNDDDLDELKSKANRFCEDLISGNLKHEY